MERRLLMIDDDIALGKLVQEFLSGDPVSIPPQPDAGALHAPRLDETLL